jgi:hypothetical protein
MTKPASVQETIRLNDRAISIKRLNNEIGDEMARKFQSLKKDARNGTAKRYICPF